jgi:hypothetical protein
LVRLLRNANLRVSDGRSVCGYADFECGFLLKRRPLAAPMIFRGRAPELTQALRPKMSPTDRIECGCTVKGTDEAKKPADAGKDNKNKPGKESRVSKSRHSTNADLDGALVPAAPVGSR